MLIPLRPSKYPWKQAKVLVVPQGCLFFPLSPPTHLCVMAIETFIYIYTITIFYNHRWGFTMLCSPLKVIICWLVVWNSFLFFHILGTIIPTDEVHHFSEGWVYHQPVFPSHHPYYHGIFHFFNHPYHPLIDGGRSTSDYRWGEILGKSA